jgi:fumarate reductase flavoprotein subunit
VVETLEAVAKSKGVDFHYKTPAVQLLREDQGRVTGAIGQNEAGEYEQFNGAKGVIVCTGGYGHNKEMMEAFTDWQAQMLPTLYEYPEGNQGDGLKMGMWIGAAIDRPPHAVMKFDWIKTMEFEALPRQPFMTVNMEGVRFMDEDLPWAYEANQIMNQTDQVGWKVWDAKWPEEAPAFSSQCCKAWVNHDPALVEEMLKNGHILQADTLEELAEKMGVPVDTFVATAKRYTEMAKKGHDDDYYKHPLRLTTLEKPPYYACQIAAVMLVTLGGLSINEKMQVLDTNKQVVPGLYAAGNASGNFFFDEYVTTVPGTSHSRAITFGRLAAQNALAS